MSEVKHSSSGGGKRRRQKKAHELFIQEQLKKVQDSNQ
jgi:hypothetical protein